MKDFSLVLLCAGNSIRSELDVNKTLYKMNNKPIFTYSLETFISSGIKNIVIAVKEDEKQIFEKYIEEYKNVNIKLVKGGLTRQESVKNSIKKVSSDYILIHDAARPFIHKEDIMNIIENTRIKKACTLAKSCHDTVSIIDENNNIIEYLKRDYLYLIQTPQGFLTKDLFAIYSSNINLDKYTDDTSLYKAFYNKNVYVILSKHKNDKLTLKKDFEDLEKIRYGVGFDMHKLVKGRELILGGINIKYQKGLLGHSDADVLVHSIMDSLLSAANLKDIGTQFPDTDEKYKNISSLKLLEEVIKMINQKGFSVNNVSCEIMCEKPKLSKYIDSIEKNVAKYLKTSEENVKISATTLEGLGFIGREEGIGCYSVSSIRKNLKNYTNL